VDRKIKILLVEDNLGDAKIIRKCLDDLPFEHELFVVGDGIQAISFLEQAGPFIGSPRPDFILLDLNLPGKSGHEVLHEIKQRDDLKSIPVIILTSSTNESDISKSYDDYANCYLVKPMDLAGLLTLTAALGAFWMDLAKLPSQRRPVAKPIGS
jgi:chemotaxis family two-component system response regulator Rcp1